MQYCSLKIGCFFILVLKCATYVTAFQSISFHKNSFHHQLSRRSKLLKLTHFETLEFKCNECVEVSRNKFNNGSEYYSNPKSQMGSWIDEALREELVMLLSRTTINPDSRGLMKLRKQASFYLNSDAFSVNIFQKSCEYSLTLFYLKSRQSLPKYSHEAGTLLVYSTISGEGILQTHFSRGAIPPSQDIITSNSLTRIGGPYRQVMNNRTAPCIVLELAIYPPIIKLENTFSTEILSQSIGFDQQGTETFDLLKQPYITLENVSCSTFAMNFSPSDKKDLLILKPEIALPTGVKLTTSKSSSMPTVSALSTLTSSFTSNNSNELLATYRQIPSILSKTVGGLGPQIQDITRRLLYSRRLPPTLVSALGLTHVSGLLLYGPPGTGKTLLARQLSALLTPRDIKIVSGPEILDKYVGESERIVRRLFQDADEEWEEAGLQSALHVIVFDELDVSTTSCQVQYCVLQFDSIGKTRGMLAGDGSGVRDSVVNQLLALMDGLKQRNNVLVIALTNRMDLIDPALLRPGRLEVHIHIPPPSEKGRVEILDIQLRPLVEQGLLTERQRELWVPLLVSATHGWTGADLSGLVRCATSFLTQRYFREIDKLLDLRSELGRTIGESQPLFESVHLMAKGHRDLQYRMASDQYSEYELNEPQPRLDFDSELLPTIEAKLEWRDFILALKETSINKHIPKRLNLLNRLRMWRLSYIRTIQ